jgi:hypothetical protein
MQIGLIEVNSVNIQKVEFTSAGARVTMIDKTTIEVDKAIGETICTWLKGCLQALPCWAPCKDCTGCGKK